MGRGNKELSIIIPVFNGKNYLAKLVENIFQLNQSTDIEIIFVDDGSTDDSWQIMLELEKEHPEIIIAVHQCNDGIAGARNAGIKQASGKWITFCDQDDGYTQPFSRYLKLLETNGADIIITDYYILDGSMKKAYRVNDNDLISGSEKEYYVRELIGGASLLPEKCRLVNPPNSIWNCIFSKRLISDNKLQFMKFVDYEDDWAFQIEAIMASKKVLREKEPYYCWTVNPNSESHTGKYVQSLFEKRIDLKAWVETKCSQIGLKDDDMRYFRLAFDKRTILFTLFNETWSGLPLQQSIEYLNGVISFFQDEISLIKKYVPMNVKEKSLLSLMAKRYIKTALWLNHNLMHYYFH